jgi:predicted dehydrogenase
MTRIDRRHFLQASAVTTLSALTARGAADQPNDRVVLAVMGVRGRGRDLMNGFVGLDNVEVAYLCDPDENVVPRALKELEKRQQKTPKVEKDIRRVLEDKDVTAVVVAAPDHWHALGTIWACQAGKHVYVEKPVSHNLVEGRRMVEAARKYNRIVQVGTQRRSTPHFASAVEFIRSGNLGKVPFIRTWIAGNRPSIGHKKDEPTPKGVDYSLWLGPAAERPFNRNRFHYEWHWNWDYGTGELGNNGIHALDVARWILNEDAPVRVTSGGGKYFYDDDRQTPDTQIATFDFPHSCVIWEHRIWSKTGMEGEPFGVAVYGEKGTMIFNKAGWHVINGVEASEKSSEGERAHLKNFLACVRDNRPPNADIEEGHKSTRLCHLGNIALRVGRTLRFDAKTETIIDDAEANRLLRRDYRAPFMVPEAV